MRKESSAEATKGAPVPPIGGTDCAANTLQEREGRDAFGSGIDRIEGWVVWVNNWSDLAGDEGGGMGGGVGRWPMEGGQGGRWGGGHQRAVWEQQKVHWFPPLTSLKNLTTGLIWLVTTGGMGGGVGRWPMEGGQGGRWGGAPESSVGAIKGAWAFLKP